MDGLKQLCSQQATEWHYPNMTFRTVYCERKKKGVPILFCAVFEYGKTWDNWHNVSV
jgi:hypothetical protein